MAIKEDVERGINFEENGLNDPPIKQKDVASSRQDYIGHSLWMVLLSTAIAVCGSFEFGLCVRILFYVHIFPTLSVSWMNKVQNSRFQGQNILLKEWTGLQI